MKFPTEDVTFSASLAARFRATLHMTLQRLALQTVEDIYFAVWNLVELMQSVPMLLVREKNVRLSVTLTEFCALLTTVLFDRACETLA